MKLKRCPNSLRGCSLASVPGMLNPVSYHPLLTGASLDHQAKAKVGIFGHFYLQTSTGVPADDWTILPQKQTKILPSLDSSLEKRKKMVATLRLVCTNKDLFSFSFNQSLEKLV